MLLSNPKSRSTGPIKNLNPKPRYLKLGNYRTPDGLNSKGPEPLNPRNPQSPNPKL